MMTLIRQVGCLTASSALQHHRLLTFLIEVSAAFDEFPPQQHQGAQQRQSAGVFGVIRTELQTLCSEPKKEKINNGKRQNVCAFPQKMREN